VGYCQSLTKYTFQWNAKRPLLLLPCQTIDVELETFGTELGIRGTLFYPV
jgi:hypothetical protein